MTMNKSKATEFCMLNIQPKTVLPKQPTLAWKVSWLYICFSSSTVEPDNTTTTQIVVVLIVDGVWRSVKRKLVICFGNNFEEKLSWLIYFEFYFQVSLFCFLFAFFFFLVSIYVQKRQWNRKTYRQTDNSL